MILRFGLPSRFSHDQVRALFEAIGGALTGQPIHLVRSTHYELYDPNHGKACFDARWSEGPFVFSQRVEAGDGNPYDGYPYFHSVALEMPGRSLRVSGSGGSPELASFELEIEPCTRLEWNTLRGLLRRELGADLDRNERPWVTPEQLEARVAELESWLARLRHSFAGQLDYDLWEHGGASSATPEYAAQKRAQLAECGQEEAMAKPALEALITRTRGDAPNALEAWIAQHDAYLAEQHAACVARDDQFAAAAATKLRESWAELRDGKRGFFNDAASWPSDPECYRRLFARDP